MSRGKRSSSPSDAKTFGEINGIPVGTFFLDRKHLFEAGMHGRPAWGIHGTIGDGAYAVVVNGGYEDDRDQGETVIYTGHGKGKGKGEPNIKGDGAISRLRRQIHGLQSWEATQVGDQKWTHGNRALRRSSETKYPVRLIRGPDGNPKYSPYEGYRYDGLYEVVRFWEEKGSKGFMMCMFELQRCPGQLPLPTTEYPTDFWNPFPILRDEAEPSSSKSSKPAYTSQTRGMIEGNIDKVSKMKKPYAVPAMVRPFN
ncbi:PUA-like domain-containing protein [Collybia nuda]|uniref:PUA-like domain-containing protein n=1 Tax=Collybia nuda TaxID=64659 RepID=A0A9P5XVP6_9AGAR|nr:PUA-like domain-containing protein [Collybia nuda]